jgi:hypothetical protein
MNNPNVKMYLMNKDSTLYYQAVSNEDGTYTITPSTIPISIKVLPKGWEDVDIEYSRHPEYLGVFRSQAQTFNFVEDARYTLLDLYYKSNGGIQAECTLRIDIFYGVKIGYKTAYTSQLNFSDCDDEKFNNGNSYSPIRNGIFHVPTLDSELFTLLESLGDTVMNHPVWQRSGTGWITDCEFLYHEGIKLMYKSSYTSSATVSSPLRVDLWGFNVGQRGSFPNAGTHFIPSMSGYNIVQDNGTTTFIGNDILQPFLIQNRQTYKQWETQFNESRPYTNDNNLIYNLLNNQSGYVSVNVNLYYTLDTSLYFVIPIANYFLKIVLFEVDKDNNPELVPPVTGNYRYLTLETINLTDGSGTPQPLPTGAQITSNQIDLKYDKCYILGIISDTSIGYGVDPSVASTTVIVLFSELKLTLESNYNSGTGSPVEAPKLNESVFPIIRLKTLLTRCVKNLVTTNTDGYGFPVPVSTPYQGSSAFLDETNTTSVGDLVPYQVVLSSQYCMHNLQGRSYFSISLNQLFKITKNILGCGLSIKGNTISIEQLSLIFNKDKEILNLDLHGGVSKLKIKPFNDLGGCNLKLGYTKAETNSDFGVEAFNTELFFNTPLTKNRNTIELQETDVITEQYAIEKIRAQVVKQPVSTVYDPANPSSDNQNVLFYCQPSAGIILPYLGVQPYDPENNPVATAAFKLNQRPTAQSTNSSASDYIYGMKYPDTAYNLELSPCRMLKRGSGAILRSVLDLMDTKDLVFRNTTIITQGISVTGLSGIESNLGSGVITEFKDIKINSLPDPLFRPWIFELTTVSAVNMWEIIQNDQNGYVSFTWKGMKLRGFIWKINQKLAASAPTRYELLVHPNVSNDQLKNS